MSPKRFLAAVFAVLAVGAPQCLTTVAHADEGGVTVVAGTGAAGSSGDGGPASAALLKHPTDVAVASDGTVYISDADNHRVRAVAPDGTISTVAGTGQTGIGPVPDGARGTEVALVLPTALAVDADRTLYIADAGRSQVFALRADGRLLLVAGDGTSGFAGDGGPATKARLGLASGLAVGPDRTLYIADRGNNRVRAVSPDGVISTVAGNGGGRVTAAGGPATATPLVPNSVSVDGQGNVWIASGLLLLRLSGGKLATVTTPGGGNGGKWGTADDATWPPADAPMNNVAAVAVGGDSVYVLADREVSRLGPGNVLEPVASLAEIDNPISGPIAATSSAVYLVDNIGHRVYTFKPASGGTGDEDGKASTSWLLPAGAVALVLLVVVGGLVVRRRR